ncbi:MAG TPA: hypothetical protein DEP45_06925 [Armatimonadetes bacterium]|nr:hypothetical protein [Armatimonadota bacterium]
MCSAREPLRPAPSAQPNVKFSGTAVLKVQTAGCPSAPCSMSAFCTRFAASSGGSVVTLTSTAAAIVPVAMRMIITMIPLRIMYLHHEIVGPN